VTASGRLEPFVIADPTVGRYLAPAGAWTSCVDDALCLSRAEATAWVTRMSCEPFRLSILPFAAAVRDVA
jgi:hypothetical protein